MAPGNSELKCFSLAAVGARSRTEIPSARSAGTTSRKSVVLPAPAIPETSITISPEVHRKRAAPLWFALRFTIGSWISRSPEMRAEHLPQASLTVASIWRSSWRTRSVARLILVKWLNSNKVRKATRNYAAGRGSISRSLLTRASEICIEILSPSNSAAEIAEKRILYFDAGAAEVWICNRDGSLAFYSAPDHQI